MFVGEDYEKLPKLYWLTPLSYFHKMPYRSSLNSNSRLCSITEFSQVRALYFYVLTIIFC